MNFERPAALLDTSVQIKRLVSARWKADNLDRIWSDLDPVVSSYTLMEYKNSLIAAIRFLISVLEEIKEIRGMADEDVVRVRLAEVITQLNIDTSRREKQRRRALANAYAAQILCESEAYPRARSVDEVIDQLAIEAENLEQVWFYHYCCEGTTHRMRELNWVDCHLAKEMSPMTDGLAGYHCRRGRYPCKIVWYWGTEHVAAVVLAVTDGHVRVKDRRLRRGTSKMQDAIARGGLEDGRSVGEMLCLPVGDTVIVSTAVVSGTALMTADKDQVAIAAHFGVPCMFYDARRNLLVQQGATED